MKASYPFPPKDGPKDPSGRPCFLPLVGCQRTQFSPSCPHCKQYVDDLPAKEGEHNCPKCGRTFFLHLLPGYFYLTSKVRTIHAFLWN